ncbi:unnamed protein product [Eruca vesicaria subsp. sativa]|uniref:Uncharacterized protein n=1 Tax=Eruca vesicaria subsp. sativa TaxID=29727 RepID=A0ABC8K3F1_ERUVS|nr:unnamed protein product [Eruca vesicaria subsp. sativa]
MAKTTSSICFTTLLLVVLFISAEIPKSEASCTKFLGEAILSYPCSESSCEAKCAEHYHESCRGECEDHDHHHDGVHLTNDDDDHCHCYGRY